MMATQAMITAARRAEYDYYQRRGALGERFIPTPDAVRLLCLKGDKYHGRKSKSDGVTGHLGFRQVLGFGMR